MKKIIMFSHKPVFKDGKTFGPSIRLWEMAKALSRKGHDITIAEKDRMENQSSDSINFVRWDTDLLKSLKENYDVTILQSWCDDDDLLHYTEDMPRVVDFPAPTILEHSMIIEDDNDGLQRFIEDIVIPKNKIIAAADILICLNERQRHMYIGMLSALGRINPNNHDEEKVITLPMGIPTDNEISDDSEEKTIAIDRFKAISEGKKTILWLGGIFPWYDTKTCIKAMEEVIKEHPETALVFVGSKNPIAPDSMTKNGADETIRLAKEKGLLDKNVFFMDWIPYSARKEIFKMNDIALMTYKDCLETEFSYRFRLVDYLWAGLPMICTEGDVLSDEIKISGLGLTYKAGNHEELAKNIIKMLSEDKEAYKDNIKEYAKKNLDWDEIIRPLSEYCENPIIDLHKRKFHHNSMIEYLHGRLRDKEETIQEMHKMIKDKEVNKERIIDQKEIEKERIIEERTRDVQEIIKNKENEISELKSIIKDRDTRIEDLNEKMVNLDGDLKRITGSRSWKVIKSFDKLKMTEKEKRYQS